MIHAAQGCFVIRSHGVWIPGVYETRKAARYAFQFDNLELSRLQNSKNPGGVITTEDLRKLRGKR